MKKFISIITMFVLSVTLLSVPVQAEVDAGILFLSLRTKEFMEEEPSGNERDVIDVFDKTLGASFEMLFLSSDNHEDIYTYTLIPKEREMRNIAKDAQLGDKRAMDEWDEITEELREISVYIQSHASFSNDNKYALMVFHPYHEEFLMWMAFDGEVIYDDVHDIDDTDKLFNKI